MQVNNEDKDIIYHYCSEDVGKKILSTKQLKFSIPSEFNDPFDCSTDLISLNLTEEDVKIEIERGFYKPEKGEENLPPKVLLNRLQKYVYTWENPDIKDVFRDILKDTLVCCFSKNFKQILMWSHYADKHKGMCIGFKREVLENITQCKSIIVKYDHSFTKENLFPRKGMEQKTLKHWISNKSILWRYEEEVRLYRKKSDNPKLKNNHFIPFDEKCVAEIFLGCNCILDTNTLQHHLNIENYKDLKIIKLKKATSKFELE